MVVLQIIMVVIVIFCPSLVTMVSHDKPLDSSNARQGCNDPSSSEPALTAQNRHGRSDEGLSILKSARRRLDLRAGQQKTPPQRGFFVIVA